MQVEVLRAGVSWMLLETLRTEGGQRAQCLQRYCCPEKKLRNMALRMLGEEVSGCGRELCVSSFSVTVWANGHSTAENGTLPQTE